MAAKTKEGQFIEDYILKQIPNDVDKTKVMNCIRLALTGKADGMSIGDIMYLIGPEETQERINKMIEAYDQSKNI